MSDKQLDIGGILDHLPHRYPFLLIDRVVDYKEGEWLRGYKNVTFNEPFFTGHFPQDPIMPGVLILEALAQATGLLAFRTAERHADKNSLYFLVGIDKARFKQPVVPGDQLGLDVKVKAVKRGLWVFEGGARVDGKVVASAELMCTEREVDA
jgi:3-hydroxyacyl-[acyl-carrier-protein] dehydratase